MPSRFSSTGESYARRRFLSGLGTAVIGGFAGCSGRVPGAGPKQLDTESVVQEKDDPSILWRYPPRDGDVDGIGYAEVEFERVVRREHRSPAMQLEFNSTIGGIASQSPYEGYHLDWFRFRIWPPESYEEGTSYEVRVQPPGQWDDFSVYYELQPTVRQTIVELRDADTQGTILVPAVFDPGGGRLPESLHCSFTVQASRPGTFGNTVRVADEGTLPLDHVNATG